MAVIKKEQMPREAEFMTDLWKFRKQFYNGEDSDDFWILLVGDADVDGAAQVLMAKYDHNEYFDECVRACVADIERRWQNELRRNNQN